MDNVVVNDSPCALTEREMEGIMEEALAEKQFLAYYQPQYNHTTGLLVGAEALVRWKHPNHGLIAPANFIPLFEKNGFITKLDLYVFEQVCIFLRKCIDEKLPLVAISTNFSRYDIFQPDFVEELEATRLRHDVPVKYLRVEITESSVMGNHTQANEVMKALHEHGYVVEMDDFGSGYSSLNVLKDIDMDIVKLDMLFLSEEGSRHRGGIILSSVVRMFKWLGLPVIAEGVESIEQADFLKSIGCDYMQGYLYAKPLPGEEFYALLGSKSSGRMVPQLKVIDNLNVNEFWDPRSQETLIFNNFVCRGNFQLLSGQGGNS